jgi:uncharacterized pyridoxamine 5'-phosphate oxidase family protein
MKFSNLKTFSKTEFCKRQRKKSFLVKITAVNIQYIAARKNLNQEPPRVESLYQDNDTPMFTPTEWLNMADVFGNIFFKYI